MAIRLFTVAIVTLIALQGATTKNALSARQANQDESSELASRVRELSSSNVRKRQASKKAILLFSSKSASSRQSVITAMLRIVAQATEPNGEFRFFLRSPKGYRRWSEATDILGSLRAREAIEPLIDCLDCNDGKFSFGIGHFPATKAIVKFGAHAIPKLEEALQQKPAHIRLMAVQALHAIGGEKAKQILTSALQTERDETVTDTIRNLLVSWRVSGKQRT